MSRDRRAPTDLPEAADRPLFTPGPLTTSRTVKQAMLRDLGSRDAVFIETVRRVRDRLLALAGTSKEAGFEAVIMQGSGTFGVESVIGSSVPQNGRLLVIANGAYGERMVRIAAVLGIDHVVVRSPEDALPDPEAVDRALSADEAVTHVAMVHCETTTGIVNPVEAVARAVRRHGRRCIVDSMSAFGALPVDVEGWGIDYLVSSSNKCIEGVPGFSFVICQREALLGSEGWARSLALDLLSQWKGLEANGQFRFTPPTHAILAFAQALDELDQEGGPAARHDRYAKNQSILLEGMEALGLPAYLPRELQGPVITSFRYPEHPAFSFEAFYRRLSEEGFVIYPGKVSDAACFRIGTIGRISPADVRNLLAAVSRTLASLGVQGPF